LITLHCGFYQINRIVYINTSNSLPAKKIKDKKPNTNISKTTNTDPMEKLYSILHKITIDSIPILTEEEFLIWSSIVVNLLELLKIKTTLLSEYTKLTSSEELMLHTLMSLIVPIRKII
ncbi:hypothetical protein VP01_8789g1, partial [Puccinia sorghi]